MPKKPPLDGKVLHTEGILMKGQAHIDPRHSGFDLEKIDQPDSEGGCPHGAHRRSGKGTIL